MLGTHVLSKYPLHYLLLLGKLGLRTVLIHVHVLLGGSIYSYVEGVVDKGSRDNLLELNAKKIVEFWHSSGA